MYKLAAAILLATFATSALADTYVQGHYRKDGTYVPGHYRSDPNSSKSDNYGRPNSKQPNDPYQRQQRDQDNDGIANQYDYDDDNDGVLDQYE